MNKPASTLSIRLQLPPDDEKQQTPAPDEVIYLWDRIILAALAAAIVVIGIVAGAWYAMSGPGPEPLQPAVIAGTAPADAQPSPELLQRGNAVAATAAPQQQAAPVQPAIGGPVVKPLAADIAPLDPVASEQAPLNAATPAGAVRADRSAAADLANSPVLASDTPAARAAEASNPAAPAPANTIDNSAPQQSMQQPAEVEVLSDHLLHAQLSNRLVNRKPLDLAPAVMSMNEQGLLTVYFYTELQDLEGETLYYNWYREDERVARVRARPQKQLTNAYSSKFIDRHMLGQWRVELNTAAGATLARAQFEVRDAAFAANINGNAGS